MNRFFSKLDLREIRIDPRSSRFPPEGGEAVEAGADWVDRVPIGSSEGASTDRPAVEAPMGRENGPLTRQAERTAAGEEEALTVADLRVEETLSLGHDPDSEDDVLKVSARSRPSAVAGAIAGVVREAGRAEVQAIGAGATNQAVKAVAIARDYLSETGIDVICLPGFIDVTINNEDRTAIRLVIEPR